MASSSARRITPLRTTDQLLSAAAGRPRSGAPRFTLDGDEALERSLEAACARALSGVRGIVPESRLRALLLGGGYGRGEGGVLHTPDGDRPYNDFEFYVALEGNRHLNEILHRQALESLAHILTRLTGVEVEFKIVTLGELLVRPPSMFTYDLLAGNRVVWADAAAAAELDPAGCPDGAEVPLAEASRLMMNRCSGLLLARELLDRESFPDSAADFVRRNAAKASLACGDALLAAHGRYHWSCRERHRRLQELARETPSPLLESVLLHHAAGVAFKLHPVHGGGSRAELLAVHRDVSGLARNCWLWLESRRLGRAFPSVRAYAEDAVDRWPDERWLRNAIVSARAGGIAALTTRHPRDRVLRTLSLLLWEPQALTEPALRRIVQRDVGQPVTTLKEAIPAYRRVWSHFC